MKGQITIVELIFVLVALLIAFGIFFPRLTYENRWKEAYLMINSRDLILTMDRMNKLYEYSFDKNSLSIFIDSIIPTNRTNLVAWSEIEGTIFDRMIVACNCTINQINEMNFWFDGLKINGRNVKILFIQSPLETIPEETNVLLIRGYKPLGSSQPFNNYIARGVGIVEMMDFKQERDVNGDNTQKEIFGLIWVDIDNMAADYMVFRNKPSDSSSINYVPYKYFYHIPFPLNGSSYESILGCDYQSSAKGKLTLGATNYSFWICSGSSVWFDTDANGAKDTLVNLEGNVTIGGYSFALKYINDNQSIALSFRPEYTFPDILSSILVPGDPNPQGWAWGTKRIADIEPIDNNMERVLIKAVKAQNEYPAVILNASSRVVWLPDFAREGQASDDGKMLLLSLLLWASKKQSTSILYTPLKSGYSSSYINVMNQDMFEVYRFNLGLAYPY